MSPFWGLWEEIGDHEKSMKPLERFLFFFSCKEFTDSEERTSPYLWAK